MQSIYVYYPVSDIVSQGSPWANRLIFQLTIKPLVKFLQIGSPEFHLIPLVYFFCIHTRYVVSSYKQAFSLHFHLMLVERIVPLETKLWVQTSVALFHSGISILVIKGAEQDIWLIHIQQRINNRKHVFLIGEAWKEYHCCYLFIYRHMCLIFKELNLFIS